MDPLKQLTRGQISAIWRRSDEIHLSNLRRSERGQAPGPSRRWKGDGRAAHLGTAEGVGREGRQGEEEGAAVTHLDLMHGLDWSGQRVTGWLVQEKFNGLRALWTGRGLVSRTGQRFNSPAWFTAGLPDVPLDGELYAGIGTLGRISNTLARHKSGKDEDWQGVTLCAFDAPAVPGTYITRHAAAKSSLNGCGANVRCASFSPLESIPLLRGALDELHRCGGEGFILRDPSAPYAAGRTDRLLKFKDAMR